jgi:hypothetical protein
VAGPPDLRWLVVCAGLEAHHNGGDVVVWGTGAEVASMMLLDGADHLDEALDVQVSPDSSVAVAAVEGRLHAWAVPQGRALWQVSLDPVDGEADIELEDTITRVGFSRDGRRVAVGSVATAVRVVDVGTGEVLLAVTEESFDPVALDAGGRWLAHGAPLGEIVVRDVATGAVVFRHDTGLERVNALALAPDGSRLLVAGGAVGGPGPAQAGSFEAVPAAAVLTLDGGRVTAAATIRPREWPAKMSAESPFAAMGTRAVWAGHRPLVFAADDHGAVLFDGTGRTLWMDPDSVVGNFSPDGRVLVVVGEHIDAIFPAALAGLQPDEPDRPYSGS